MLKITKEDLKNVLVKFKNLPWVYIKDCEILEDGNFKIMNMYVIMETQIDNQTYAMIPTDNLFIIDENEMGKIVSMAQPFETKAFTYPLMIDKSELIMTKKMTEEFKKYLQFRTSGLVAPSTNEDLKSKIKLM